MTNKESSSPDHRYHPTVQSHSLISETIIHITATGDIPTNYQAGQYININIGHTTRSLSLASAPGTKTIEFIIDTSPGGPASRYALSLKPGDRLDISGPYGSFTVDHTSHRPRLFIAGGAGLAPIRAMIQSLPLHSSIPNILIFGTKKPPAVWLLKELFNWADQNPRHLFLPITETPPSRWPGWSGTAVCALKKISGLSACNIYICGGSGLVSNATNTAFSIGTPIAHIHTELFT